MNSNVINFRTVALILAIHLPQQFDKDRTKSDDWCHHSGLSFIRHFAGPWPVRPKTTRFRFFGDHAGLYFHFRCFSSHQFIPTDATPNPEGIRIHRQSGTLPSLNKKIGSKTVTECRFSIQMSTAGPWEQLPDMFPIFTTTILSDDDLEFRPIWKINDEKNCPFAVTGPACAEAILQHYVYFAIQDFWEANWKLALSAIDECLSVDVRIVSVLL